MQFITIDPISDKVYVHSGYTATVLDSFSCPSALGLGATMDGTDLVTLDRGDQKVFIHSGISSTISSSFTLSESDLTGLT